MKKDPLVSIVMNCHNGQEFLNYSINSIINQTYTNWELIFWDNKSTDNSKTIVKSFNDKRIKYFYSKRKSVLYKARNLAIKKTRGKYIAFLDVDDLWEKNKLALQVPKFKDRSIGLVYSNFYKLYEDKIKIAYKNKLPSGNVTSSIIKDYKVGFVTIMLRKSFIKNRPFDYKYDLLSDYDFILNFSLKHKFSCINKPLAYYRIHDNQFQKRNITIQAKQFCKWYDKKKIKKVYQNFDLSTINKKYNYFDLVKELDNSKIKLIAKTFKNFDLLIFLKIIAFFFIPKKMIIKFIDNV